MQPLMEYFRHRELAVQWRAVEEAATLEAMMAAAWVLARTLALMLMSQVLAARAQQPIPWPGCEHCGHRLRSKGWVPRQWTGLLGTVVFKRRVGRCPRGCKTGLVAPLDRALGLEAYARTSRGLEEAACLLAVFVPFERVARLLKRLVGVEVSPSGVWTWGQGHGERAMRQLDAALRGLSEGERPAPEPLSAEQARLPLAIGADGVSVPFRPEPGQPGGKIAWREVKVGVLARLKPRGHEEAAVALEQRRVVAVRGNVEALRPRLWLEALRQGVQQAPQVVWLSDGGPGFWRLFRELFAARATGILDFYHAAQNLWKAVKVWKDGRSRQARVWWTWARRRLRYGSVDDVLVELYAVRAQERLPGAVRQALENLCTYLETHRDHTDYARFKREGWPIGSGMVESACKWLIQQRFKGVGMRWSEAGFNHLLHLRVLWANDRFESLFA